VTFIACSEDYTAVIASGGEVLVTGNLENGKLGLGESQNNGLILSFTRVPYLNGITYLAAGPNHMVALQSGLA